VVDDRDMILEELVPKDPSSLKHYLSYLYETGDAGSASKAWEKRALFGFEPDWSETLRHIDFLIAKGELNKAYDLWRTKPREAGPHSQGDGNLITNGGFEREGELGTGFDWKIEAVAGAEISIDSGVSFEGKRS